MISMECPQCGKLYEGDGSDVKNSLRAHILGSPDHKYEKDSFEELFEEDSEEETEPQVSEEEPESEEVDEEDQSEDFDLNEVGSMEGNDLDTLVKEAEEGEDHEPETDKSTRTGLDTAINNGWGRLLTADLDPEDEEVENMRKNLKGLAEDVGLGENAKHYYDEHLSGESDDPKTALLGSLALATILSLSLRPDLGQKLMSKAKEQTNNGGDE